LKTTDILQTITKKRRTLISNVELTTKEKILGILEKEDSYGYKIWKKLGKIMTRPAIYQHLNELEQRGLIISYSKDGRRFFKITERGRRVLRAIEELKVLL